MCEFFSCVTTGSSKLYYFDWPLRQKCLSGELDYSPDSHASIASYFKLDEDKCNKYEYNPMTKLFEIDQLNARRDDSKSVEKKLRALDFSAIVPQVKFEMPVNPFEIRRARKAPTKKELEMLKQCAVVRRSVRGSVGDSVRDSVWRSVWDSVWRSVWDSVGDSVRDSVWYSEQASVWDSVGYSVGYSVQASVWDSVYCQGGALFPGVKKWKGIKHEKGKYPFYCYVYLWNRGLVPSFDGTTWRLHAGKKAEIVYDCKAKDLK